MSEKRFRISQGYTDRVCYDWQNNQLLNFRKTVELLNELVEENQRLKEDIDELDKKSDELHDEKIRLIRENTRLKKKLKEHNDMLE